MRDQFAPLACWDTVPIEPLGRQQNYRDTAIQTYAGFSDRLIGLDWTIPSVCTLYRRKKTLVVIIPYRGSESSLH